MEALVPRTTGALIAFLEQSETKRTRRNWAHDCSSSSSGEHRSLTCELRRAFLASARHGRRRVGHPTCGKPWLRLYYLPPWCGARPNTLYLLLVPSLPGHAVDESMPARCAPRPRLVWQIWPSCCNSRPSVPAVLCPLSYFPSLFAILRLSYSR